LCHIFRRPIIIYSVKYVKSFRGENIGFAHFEGVYLPLVWEPNFCFKSPITLGYTRGHFTALVPLERSELFTYMPNGNLANNSNNAGNAAGATNCFGQSSVNSTFSSNLAGSASQTNVSGATGNSNSSNNNQIGAVSVSYLENGNDNQNHQSFYLPLVNNEGQLLPVHFLTSAEIGREKAILRQYLNLECCTLIQGNCGLYVAQQRIGKLVKTFINIKICFLFVNFNLSWLLRSKKRRPYTPNARRMAQLL
jgi:hypothetical protein